MIYPCKPLAGVNGPEKIGRFRREDAGELPETSDLFPRRSSHLQGPDSSRPQRLSGPGQGPPATFQIPHPIPFSLHEPSSALVQLTSSLSTVGPGTKPRSTSRHHPRGRQGAVLANQSSARAGTGDLMRTTWLFGTKPGRRAQAQFTLTTSPAHPTFPAPIAYVDNIPSSNLCYSAETRRGCPVQPFTFPNSHSDDILMGQPFHETAVRRVTPPLTGTAQA